jgi:hypothetical protein
LWDRSSSRAFWTQQPNGMTGQLLITLVLAKAVAKKVAGLLTCTPFPSIRAGYVTTFQGCRSPGEPPASVLFVHGLGGHHYDTWRCNTDGKPWDEDDTFWPFWLARDCEPLAVYVIGYDAPISPRSLMIPGSNSAKTPSI